MVFSYIKSFFYNLIGKDPYEEYDKEMEEWVAQELIKLDIEREVEEENEDDPSEQEIPKNDCFQRTGVIDYLDEGEGCVLIDGMFFYDITACSIPLKLNDKVKYLCHKDSNDSLVVVRILENLGEHWGDNEFEAEENGYQMIEHVVIGEVDYRQDRMVIMKESDVTFSLDKVMATFVPIKGDLLELLCKVKYDEDKPMDIALNNVVEVVSFRPVRSKVLSTTITQWNGEEGICARQIYLSKHCVASGGEIQVGAKAFIEAVESNQGICAWRVIKIDIKDSLPIEPTLEVNEVDDIEQESLETEKRNKIEITFPLKFDNVKFHERPQIDLTITNVGNQPIIMYKWMLLCKKRDSQISIIPTLNNSTRLYPNKTLYLTVTCNPKFYGRSKEHMIITFRGFKVERLIEINILCAIIANPVENRTDSKNTNVKEIMNNIRNGPDHNRVRGVPLKKNPNFVAVKLGNYNIPDKVWSAVLGNNYEQADSPNEVFHRIETRLPCLLQNLNINNYTDRWHTLLYLEEIQGTINVRKFNMKTAFLVKHQEYLGLTVKKLAERRPCIVIGDRVVVKDIWDDHAPSYEGYVHVLRGDLVLMKFHPRFHDSYRGGDVSVEFHYNRSQMRKAHHAINLAISALGPDVLFPSRLLTRPPQIPLENLETMKWYNPSLNTRQKEAVRNILIGECRPMPYCIFGPPGTGKTVTVVETLLQILTLIPDSRILVATPSNSAANLITERLLEYRHLYSSSVIRLIANYLVESQNIPEIIKPFCATLDIAIENTARSIHVVQNGINVGVPASYVTRHRVTIGTCYCLGSLANIKLPKGHYTHIIVDESGQAIEPEIMIPMSFVNKESGQIIVAGDPMQLGPVVMSIYAMELGMDISYLSRMLETFPYQKDFAAFESGFNNKLVTQLTDNYRSLQEILSLPSRLFYDGTLVAKMDRNTPFVPKMIDVVSEIFDMTEDVKTGGVFVYGIRGNNARDMDSPSWFNPEEASMVALTMCKLFKMNISPEDVGIITPYVAQIKHLRRVFENMLLERPKIGTVEEFQGQERPLIIISTVRSSEALLGEDQKHSLGFVKCPKRFNVALTRAQVAVILFCDPYLLRLDPLWNQVISQAYKENKYMGCALPPMNVESNDVKI